MIRTGVWTLVAVLTVPSWLPASASGEPVLFFDDFDRPNVNRGNL